MVCLGSSLFSVFEEVAAKLNKFPCRFEINALMFPFLVDTLEEIVREMCNKFIFDNVLEKLTSTTALIKLNVHDKNIHKGIAHVGFGLKQEISELKKEGKVKDTKICCFFDNVKQFLSTLCNHLLTKSPLQYQYARCC